MVDLLSSDKDLIVYVDIKSPYAFVALKPTRKLEAALGITIDWRPLTLNIPSYLGSAKKQQGKVVESSRSSQQWGWVKYAYKDTRRYAERQGYILKGTEKIWDSSIANIGILWACNQAPERLSHYFDAVYPPFWMRALDIEDPTVIAGCLQQAGIPAAGFFEYQQGAGRAQHDAMQAGLHEQGIFGVPTYVIEGEVLFGREHLPWIRWKLGGAIGPAPDIAYKMDATAP